MNTSEGFILFSPIKYHIMDNDNLRNKYKMLKAANNLLEKEIEDKKQAIHNTKTQLALSSALRLDLEEEIEALRSNKSKELIESKKYLKKLENERATLKMNFHQQMSEKSELIESLHNQLVERKKENMEKASISINEPSTETNICLLLNEKIKNYSRNLIETQIHIDTFEQECLTTQEDCNKLKAEIDEIKTSLTYETQETEKSKERICALQEEIAAIKLELESKISKPLDVKQRGNSMFAEIEDNFIKMQKKRDQFKKKFERLEQKVSKTFKQIEEFNNQDFGLDNQFDALEDRKNKYEQKIEAYKSDILIKETAIKEHKKDILKDCEFTGEGLSKYASGFANNIIKAKWRELELIRDDLNNVSAAKLITGIDLKKSNLELFEWKKKENTLKIEVTNLKSALLEAQLKNTNFILEKENIKTEIKSNSSASTEKSHSDITEIKPNDSENSSANLLQNEHNRDSSGLVDQLKHEYDEEELFLDELEAMKNNVLSDVNFLENKVVYDQIENTALNGSLNDSFSNNKENFISERANKLMSRKSAVVGYYTLTTPDVSINHDTSVLKTTENLPDEGY